jgi:3-oxoacyl-[acyl-carrier protein] reductase
LFEERVVLVTGSSKGIGKSTALYFLKNGANVVFNYSKDGPHITKLKQLLSEFEDRYLLCQADVSDVNQVRKMFKEIKEKWGKLDIVVNNAGITSDGWVMMMGDQKWDSVLDVNLKGTFLCIREAARMMSRSKSGVIINVTSTSGIKGQPGQANYSASKGGVIALTRTVAKELAPYGIRVNAVAPGFIKTAMTTSIPQDILENYKKLIPVGRIGETDEVAEVIGVSGI